MRVGVAVAFLLIACGGDPTAPLNAHAAHGVAITVTAPGSCLVGGCDPPGTGMTLTLVSIVNSANTPVYLHACGTQVAAAEQEVDRGDWVDTYPDLVCGETPGPIALAAGDSLGLNWWFLPGTRRVVLGVSTNTNETDEALATSAGFNLTPP